MELCEKRPNLALIKGQDRDFCPLQWNLVCPFQGNREQHWLGRRMSWYHTVPSCSSKILFKGAPKWDWTEKSPVPGLTPVNSTWVWESVCDICDSSCLCSVLITAHHPASGHNRAHKVDLGLPWAAAASEFLLRNMEKVCCPLAFSDLQRSEIYFKQCWGFFSPTPKKISVLGSNVWITPLKD